MKTVTKFKIGFSAVLAALLVAFVALNMQVIQVNLLVAQIEIRRSVMILGVFLIGVLVGWTMRAVFGAVGKAERKTTNEGE